MIDQPTGWIQPPDPSVAADYWITRRSADCAPGYGHDLPDIRVQYRWAPARQAWITGEYQGIQRREAVFSLLPANNGWRIEGPVVKQAAPADAKCQEANALSRESYIPCGASAVFMVKTRDPQPYAMCEACADHNVRNRGAEYVLEDLAPPGWREVSS